MNDKEKRIGLISQGIKKVFHITGTCSNKLYEMLKLFFDPKGSIHEMEGKSFEELRDEMRLSEIPIPPKEYETDESGQVIR